MNKKVIYFLINQGILIMVYKKIILLALFLCFSINIYGKVLYEKQDLNKENSEKILREAKLEKRLIDDKKLFEAQSHLIKDINTELTI